MSLRYLSVCSGIEAASVAWEMLGFTPAGFSEIEAFPSEVLAYHYGSNMPGEPLSHNAPPNYGDFTTIDPAMVGPVDLLVGGTPCQAFSIAGQRLSLADARGNLTLAYAVLCHELARSNGLLNALWENVPGVLNTPDNAFGCFLGALVGGDDALPAPDGGGWPGQGMAAGPRARVAWRVLDAQYFGLAQRRKRVFVVVDFGNGADPAAVLFERQGLRGNSPPRRQARQGIAADAQAGAGTGFGGGHPDGHLAGTVSAKWAKGSGGPAGDEVQNIVAFKAPHFTRDKDGAPAPVAPPLSADADKGDQDSLVLAYGFDPKGGGKQTTLGFLPELVGALDSSKEKGVAFAIQERAVSENPDAGPAGKGWQEEHAFTLEARNKVQAVAFAQNTRDEVRFFASDGSIVGALSSERGTKQQCYVAFAIQERAVCENPDAGPVGAGVQQDVAYTLEARSQVQSVACVEGAARWAVRRLTPVECERLQGFPDNWTAIPRKGRPASECPDGPRYRALGNSMAVPVMRWIGARLLAAMPEKKS